MEPLHAPWRIQYILAPKPPAATESLFARISQSNDDEANHVICRERACFALLNRYPYTGGHLLVVRFISGRASSRIAIGGAQDIREMI